MPNTWGALALDLPQEGSSTGSLTAAALPMTVGRDRVVAQNQTWQHEVWEFYDALGEFRYGVAWLSEMVSRCRLTAAREQPAGDEPEILTPDTPNLEPAEKTAMALMDELAGGIGGQASMLEDLTTYLSVPGEGWVVGEDVQNGTSWRTLSADEIRRGRRKGGMVEVLSEESTPDMIRWTNLAPGALVIRVWRPHKRYHYQADSPSQAAREIMRELVLINRKIQAQYLSRLASCGVIVFPTEVTFPVPEHLQNAADPFVEAWIEAAAAAIKTPGTAAAMVPIPIRVPGEYVDKIKHIDFTLKIDEKEIEKRESAIKRLATSMDLPAEVLLGMGDVNHWTAWQLEESGIKAHIAPVVELICTALTTGYLHPRMKAANQDPRGLVVWYDPSELKVRPDRTNQAVELFDRFELSSQALRRETGFTEADAPDTKELKEIFLRFAARQPAVMQWALGELGVTEKVAVETPGAKPPAPRSPSDKPGDARTRGEPTTKGDPPPAPGKKSS